MVIVELSGVPMKMIATGLARRLFSFRRLASGFVFTSGRDSKAQIGFSGPGIDPRGRGLLAYFSICSAAVFGLATAILVLGYANAQRTEMLEMAENQNLTMSQTLVNVIEADIIAYVDKAAKLSTEEIRTLPDLEVWSDRFRKMIGGLPVLNIEFYTPEGRSVLTSEGDDIGEYDHGKEDFTFDVDHIPEAQMRFREKFDGLNGSVENVYVSTTHIPVRDSQGKVRAVIEFYTNSTMEVEETNDRIWKAAALILLAFGLLYLALYGIVRRADRTIRTQYSALTDLNTTLERRVAERTAASEAAASSLAAANLQLTAEIEVREQVEKTLRNANMALDEATRAKSHFLANMSHEIRTPMNGIFGMTDLLLKTPLSDRQHRLTSTISQSARNLLTVVNDILDLSRIEAGKLEIDRHEFDLRHCVEGAVDLFSDEAARKKVGLSLLVEHDLPLVVWGDQGRLRQIFVNLIGNAVKFTSAGEVGVRVTQARGQDGSQRIRFEVRDTGMGIDAETKARLCQPFVQADSSISRRYGGTGLGLSITRHLVELMGGELAIESSIGEGATISFELGLEHGDASLATRSWPERRLERCRVLVVDDRETNREILCHYLEAAGAEVVAVAGADEALAALAGSVGAGTPFEVALVDVIMPEQSGLDLLQAIAARPELASLKCVLVTSMTWAGDITQVRRLGGHGLLTKPVNESELVATVARVLSSASAHEETANRPKPSPVLNARVLLAEDNPVNIEVAREYLGALGCDVHVVMNGREALAASASQGFDAILMDCQMPDMDGLAATRAIRARERERNLDRTPIIAMTAHAYAEDKERCLEAGMDDYLSKPFSEHQLAEVLGRWCAAGAATRTGDGDVDIRSDGPAPNHDALDGAFLTSLKVARPGLLERLIRTYLDHSTQTVRGIRPALDANDMVALTMSAHSLKSASANVGAKTLAEACSALERAANRREAEEVQRLVAEVELLFKEACRDLGSVLMTTAKPATA